MDTVKLAPLRSLDDFILTTSRFQVPDFHNREKYLNRLVANLLYYQTNYFLTSIFMFATVIVIHPQKVALGITTLAIMIGLVLYFKFKKEEIIQMKERHPKMVLVIIVICVYAIGSVIGSIIVIMMGVGLPVCFSIVHASLRLRNIRNKLMNTTQSLGIFNVTPMSLILNRINVETEVKVL